MKDVHYNQLAKMLRQGVTNYVRSKPLVISFEVTYSCTCNCVHCDHGGILKNEKRLEPRRYADMKAMLCPSVAQISGGEPLLREDLFDILAAVKKSPDDLPYLILVTNGSLLTRELYVELKKAGINRFSVSLDFPDERHDEFRKYKGLYAHLEDLIPRLASEFGNGDIAMNSAITRSNMPYLVDLARKAESWGVNISYSAYGVKRTGDEEYFIYAAEDLKMLRSQILELVAMKKKGNLILNAPDILMNTFGYFVNRCVPRCSAGRRFLVVRPDGRLSPCSMMPHARYYDTQEEMLEKFTRHNRCGDCFVAIRAYSDKSFAALARENLSMLLSLTLH
jgi:MoaA/NifB/PqqE/SkfB family radical SAM enzyme